MGRFASQYRSVPAGCIDGDPGSAKEVYKMIASMASLLHPRPAAIVRVQQDAGFTAGNSLAAVDVSDSGQSLFSSAWGSDPRQAAIHRVQNNAPYAHSSGVSRVAPGNVEKSLSSAAVDGMPIPTAIGTDQDGPG